MAKITEITEKKKYYCANPNCNNFAEYWLNDTKIHKKDKSLCREHVNQLMGKEVY